LPGSCQDLVNDYKCNCPEGYFEGENPEEELPHDCMPVKCGKPPKKDHAKTDSKGTNIYFAMDPILYKCDPGHTLDGAPDGDTTFELTCQADKSFSDAPGCQPVVCGPAMAVNQASYPDDKVFKFGDQVLYNCEEGHATDPLKPGKHSFRAKCEADGTFSGVKECLPVECPQLAAQENANFGWDSDVQPQYGDKIEVKCLAGFALDENDHEKREYTVPCKANGKLGIPGDKCQPINCGDEPKVEHGKLVGGTLFGEKMTATADKGYSTDGSAAGPKTFEFRCKKDGSFSAQKTFQRVSCGPPAKIPNAEDATVEGGFFFLQKPNGITIRPRKHMTTLGDVRKATNASSKMARARKERNTKLSQEWKIAKAAFQKNEIG
jgi:CUB/sushi domain-containing protein